MALLVVGLSYRTAPIELRERLAIPSCELAGTLHQLLSAIEQLGGVVVLSTCNRLEFYANSLNPAAAQQRLVEWLVARTRLSPQTAQAHLYGFTGRDVAHHLFRVTAGLDSMVLGESEITAQVKQAYELAHAQDATGPGLNRLFQKALHNAKLIRSRTRIAEGQASIGSVVVSLARQHFGSQLQDREVLLWGAGKAAETTARHLAKHGVQRLAIVNRTQLKAQDLASLCRGGWVSWEQALTRLAHVDLAIVCTQAPHYVIDADDLAAILPHRRSRPLVVIDLAVPRNVDPAIQQQPGISLYNIDDLHALAQAAREKRAQELERCETLIGQQVEHFVTWWNREQRNPQRSREEQVCQETGAESSA